MLSWQMTLPYMKTNFRGVSFLRKGKCRVLCVEPNDEPAFILFQRPFKLETAERSVIGVFKFGENFNWAIYNPTLESFRYMLQPNDYVPMLNATVDPENGVLYLEAEDREKLLTNPKELIKWREKRRPRKRGAALSSKERKARPSPSLL